MSGSKNIRDITLVTIESFCKRKGISIREFGDEHMGDPNFVYALRKGSKDFRMSTLQRAWDAVAA